MNILIIEDEQLAAQRLENLVIEIVPEATIVARIDTVKKAVEFFRQNETPDLTLMDIQLADGISFEIFQQCEVKSPVIFTTAYDEYALRAFKVNSIDYILKPVDKKEFKAAIEKFQRLRIEGSTQPEILKNIQDTINRLSRKYKTRFVLKVGEHLRTIDTRNIEFFYSQEKTTFCCTSDRRKLILDYTLEQLEEMLDPAIFFRINRKYIISAASIVDIISYTNSRLRLVVKNSEDNEIVVAREKVQDFKGWLDR
jgi:DNA-binding LytR/AlgR family response regulator